MGAPPIRESSVNEFCNSSTDSTVIAGPPLGGCASRQHVSRRRRHRVLRRAAGGGASIDRRTALLWTDGPLLTPLPDALLDRHEPDLSP